MREKPPGACPSQPGRAVERARVAVIGIGNLLMTDDGLGPHLLRAFRRRYGEPAGVDLLDLGTPGADLAPHVEGRDAVIVLDAVRGEDPPGTVRRVEGDGWLSATGPRVGPHDPGLGHALAYLAFAERAPRKVVLLGAIPGWIVPGTELSPPLCAAIPRLVDALARELERLGVPTG